MDNEMSVKHKSAHGFFEAELQGAVAFNARQIEAVIAAAGYALVAKKIDGVRCELQISPTGQVSAVSRSSKLLPALQLALSHIPPGREGLLRVFPRGVRLDCEVTIDGLSFQKGCGELRRKTPVNLASVRIWPISFKPYGDSATWPGALAGMSTFETRAAWAVTFGGLFAEAVGCYCSDPREGIIEDMGLLHAKYNKARAEGFEGLMVYDPHGIHRTGKVLGWWKVKPENEADGVIYGMVEGEGRLKGTMGAALVKLEDGTLCKVGSGWTDEQRADLWASFTEGVGGRYAWERYVQITYMERTDDGNLRHPTFDRFRDTEDNPGVKT